MQLSQYPQAIYDAGLQLLEAEAQLDKFQDILKAMDAEIEQAIAFDGDLKNDAQRKAKRHELQSEDEYQAALIRVRAASDQRDRLRLQLDLLQSQFAVAKLEKREAIASLEASAA